jgi:hypothetical protein
MTSILVGAESSVQAMSNLGDLSKQLERFGFTSTRAMTYSTTSMHKHSMMAVVGKIMVGDGDFERRYGPAKSLFLWVLPGHNLCGGAQRGTSLASGPSAYLTAA